MRWSKTLIPSLRDVPKDAEAASHKLGLRAGLVRQSSSGVYMYLPLGFRVLNKIVNIVRDEMNRAGANEVLLPALTPADLWKQTGRYDKLGADKISFKNRADFEFVLGPTHEEVITSLVAGNIQSFRNLPINLFQIQTKFRDEARPRFGVIRTKEFIMKDAYSFHLESEGLDKEYQNMADTYARIFSRCGLDFRIVTADSGMMGGSMSQEFMVICPYGEDRIAFSKGSYLASVEVAKRANPNLTTPASKSSAYEAFDTPNLRTIEELSHRYKLKPAEMVKTLIYMADGKPVAGLVTGDSELNEPKFRGLLGVKELRQATPQEVQAATKAPVGFAGPVGLEIPVYADWDIQGLADFVTGANEKDKHFKNVCLIRDFKVTAFGDLRNVKNGDQASDGTGALEIATSMEIGHIFKLGTRYTEALNCRVSDEKGESKTVIMGCYGIGVNRILAAAIEQNHDENGIKWPEAIAPFDYAVLTLNQSVPEVVKTAEDIYAHLVKQGKEVLYDDRDERAGVKFKDADLIGTPYQIIVGERGLKEGKIEIKSRRDGSAKSVLLADFLKS
ncbi:MAG TPA: proline--tRNA ligase [Candidatus Omnitrophota bacterium]|nr:proline--tRNA ligase [Candidatus Omnitrophota bacterium]HRK62021.1 proline--tRNA ligase [Candidatus Omnitrophota bacterium]